MRKCTSSRPAWAQELPGDWDVVQLWTQCRRFSRYGANIPSDQYVPDGVRFLRTTDIGDEGQLCRDEAVFVSEDDAAGYLLGEEDFLISRSGTVGRSFIYRRAEHGLCSYAGYLVRYQLGSGLESQFLFYFTKSRAFENWLRVNTIESTIGNVSGHKFASMLVPLPSPVHQRAIAYFLDRETEKIDTLIEKKRRLLDLLEEKRTALITWAVTKGLDPDVPMKDSEVEWLGEIPEHWEVLPLKFLMARIVDCLHSTPRYDDDGEYPAVRTSDIDGGVLRLEEAKRVNHEEYRKRITRMVPHPSDILYSREGERYGHAAMVPSDVQVCLAQRLMHFRTAPNHSAAFMMWALNSRGTYAQASLDTAGATSPHVNVETIRNFQIPVPPLKEQKEVARYIGSAMIHLDAVRNRISKAISLLQEYRTALISAAVTGQIDVRGRVPA